MELGNMYDINDDKIVSEQKIITRCIFRGFTISQIANVLHCSNSTVSNRLSDLFKKYHAKNRFEFVLSILGEIIRNNKLIIEEKSSEIIELKVKYDELISILSNIIKYKNNKKNFEYWMNEAKNKLSKIE